MQNTRLSTFFDRLNGQISQALRNPWRRLSLFVLSLLFGTYLGTAIAAVSGQLGYLDITVAAVVLLLTEVVSWVYYGDRLNFRQSLLGESLNALKLGLLYGLILIAFILGS